MKDKSYILGGGFFLTVGVAAGIGAIQLELGTPTEPQPGFFPFMGSLILILLSIILILQGWMKEDAEPVVFGDVRRLLLFLTVMAGFVVFLDRLGYVICTFIASGLILRILKIRSWRTLILTGLFLSIGTFILFDKLLGVDLPTGFLSRMW